MKMPVGNISVAVTEYFDTVIMPKAVAEGGNKAFMVGLVGGYIGRGSKNMINQYLPLAKSIGIVDAEGNFDVDTAYAQASKALSKAPLVVFGYKVDQSDLDAMKEIMLKHAV